MKYTERLLKNELFVQTQQEIKQHEIDRIYCHHEMEHALDVCRMAWILYLETHLGRELPMAQWQARKDRFYVTGLLHDIGRARQYETGEHHSAAGVKLAKQILVQIDYPVEWMEETLQIIGEHHGREEKNQDKNRMGYYIERADHLSRNCFCCAAAETCKWKPEERNQGIFC